MTADTSYKAAVDALNTLQSNASVIASIRANWKEQAIHVIPDSIEYLNRIGYQTSDLNALNVIHIAGTKGKGSTAAFTSSLLTQLAPNAKIGLYTSPHMVAVRERIRINNQPIDEDVFAKYFWQVWQRYQANPKRARPETELMPAYFRFLTMMAFHVFLQEQVDAVILEVGIGGLYDSTNIVPKPRVTLITALGIDHVAILGHTLPEIAAQKAGIFKEGCPALTVQQPNEAMAVLEQTARDKNTSSLQVVMPDKYINNLSLGLAGIHQRENAVLALKAVEVFLQSPQLPVAFDGALRLKEEQGVRWRKCTEQALQSASWPGRCQRIKDSVQDNVTWFLDGAHTTDSMRWCAEWFASEIHSSNIRTRRALVFNCTGDRTGAELLGALTLALLDSKLGAHVAELFDLVFFCPNVTYSSGISKSDFSNRMVSLDEENPLWLQHQFQSTWTQLVTTEGDARNGCAHDRVTSSGKGQISQEFEFASARHRPDDLAAARVLGSIEDVVHYVRKLGAKGQETSQPDRSGNFERDKGPPWNVLVVGSLHLVGGLLDVLLSYQGSKIVH